MRAALLAVLEMLAPFVPHVTEEIYLLGFAAHEGKASIHVSDWPDASAYPANDDVDRLGTTMHSIVEAVRRWKAERSLSVGAPLRLLRVSGPAEQLPLLEEIEQDLRSITRAAQIVFDIGNTLAVVVD
jgi:valyl-tRNA synthetase